MEKEGSIASYIISLVGGIYSMVLGVGIILIVLFRVWTIGEIGEELTKWFVIGGLALALYFLALGLWILTSSFWMKKNQSLKKGALTSLILGILSLNILAIVAGALGISRASKIKPEPKIVVKNVEKAKNQLSTPIKSKKTKPTPKKSQVPSRLPLKQIKPITPKK